MSYHLFNNYPVFRRRASGGSAGRPRPDGLERLGALRGVDHGVHDAVGPPGDPVDAVVPLGRREVAVRTQADLVQPRLGRNLAR